MYRSKKLNKKVFPQHTLFLAEVAKKMGCEVEWIDRWTGYLLNIDGQYFGYGHFPKFPLNSAVARTLCKDKVFAYQLLEKNGFGVPVGDYFIKYDPRYLDNSRGKGKEEAVEYAKRLGWPVFVKPHGMALGIHCQEVTSETGLRRAIEEIFVDDHIVIVQEVIRKPEYRLVVLDGKIVLGYEKIVPQVIGDGRKTLKQLVEEMKQVVPQLVADWDWLTRNNFLADKVLAKNEKVFLRHNANLSTGGIIGEVLEKPSQELAKYVSEMTELLGVRLAGVDLMADDLNDRRTFTVIEINSDPGFEAYMQYDRKKVEEIYKKILLKCWSKR